MSLRLSQLAIVGAAVLLLVAAGCTREEASPPPADATTAPIDDERLVTRVQARYQTDPAVAAHNIAVSATGGTVTLRGTVHSDEARTHAGSVAAGVDGVRSVQNELQVVAGGAAPAAQPTGTASRTSGSDERTPGWITTKIQAQYFVNPEVRPWNIDVTTQSDGTVTLRGEVEAAADRDEAVRIAKETEGVTRVQDRLRVKGQPAPQAEPADVAGDDAWTTAKVQAKYFLDADVKGRRIDVDARDGVVTLKGEVESEAERRQAMAIARNTDGVRSVVDQLQVRADAAVSREGQRPAVPDRAAVEDAWITTKVQAKFFLDDQVKGRDINVDTRQGVVTLKGTVASSAERQAAQAIAQETDGVSRVINQLTVDAASR